MYQSKIVILCWAAVYLAAIVAAILKRRWNGLRHVLLGAAIVGGGIGFSIWLNNAAGALLLSAALLVATFYTLKGIIKIFSKS